MKFQLVENASAKSTQLAQTVRQNDDFLKEKTKHIFQPMCKKWAWLEGRCSSFQLSFIPAFVILLYTWVMRIALDRLFDVFFSEKIATSWRALHFVP